MEIHVLGSAGAVPFGARDTTMLALEIQAALLLVDCGGSVVARLNQSSLPWQDLTAIFFTHHHIDHVFGFPHLIQALHLEERHLELPIYGPQKTLEIVQAALQLHGLDDDKLCFPITYHQVTTEKQSSIHLDTPPANFHSLLVRSCPVKHGLPAVGYRFEDPRENVSCVYSGDTGPNWDVDNFCQNTTVLIHEASLLFEPMEIDPPTHSMIPEVLHLAEEAAVEHLCLLHFSNDPQEHERRIFEEAGTIYRGTVLVGDDGLRLSLHQRGMKVTRRI